MKENRLQDDRVLTEGCLYTEEFEQVENHLWEEYLEGEKPRSSMPPEESLILTRMADKGTAQIVFTFTNLFFSIFLFAGWHISMGLLVGSCTFVGFLMATILMCQACGTGYDEEHLFIQELLVYFPVNVCRLQRELFKLLWKYVGIQVGIICVPLLINMMVDFRLDDFFTTLLAMSLSMLTVGSFIIGGSMSKMKGKR